jgi:hypothetical protein
LEQVVELLARAENAKERRMHSTLVLLE